MQEDFISQFLQFIKNYLSASGMFLALCYICVDRVLNGYRMVSGKEELPGIEYGNTVELTSNMMMNTPREERLIAYI